jgi:hypothetical protein
MSNKLNEDAMQSELAGSAFFTQAARHVEPSSPTPENTAPDVTRSSRLDDSGRKVVSNGPAATIPPSERVEIAQQQPTENIPVRTPVRPPTRRSITRYAFEFYQDQVETLRKAALAQKMMGEEGSMSKMVREALDAYITERLSRADEG